MDYWTDVGSGPLQVERQMLAWHVFCSSVQTILINSIWITFKISGIEELRLISFYDETFLIVRVIAIKSDIKCVPGQMVLFSNNRFDH